ncbi:hypothetical protein C7M61_004608 [Candidozyma pseudohaemuli]|uniref:SP-RING-type domain-containing protein n=1 Tax=Candidozyma pseudohaemuli TaxID=418784 RepID=A0A2P7YHB9_9ASCO|nr:hypothetical protein C7M61_004608 [[Candida] pseudohaemulonii]PSK35363.1 hypothetical protein C7M61_004608 [[Candida] pseudohaemulonii]
MSQPPSSTVQLRLALLATEFESTLTFFRLLKVTQLKDLCKSVGLALKGKKQDLMDRLEQYTRSCYAAGENIRLLAIRSVVLKMLNHDPVPDFHTLCHALQLGLIDTEKLLQQNNQQNTRLTHGMSAHTHRKPPQPSNPMAGGYSLGNTLHGSVYYPRYTGPMLLFQSTLFYRLIRMVHGFPYMMVASKGRNVCNVPVSLNSEEVEALQLNPDARLYLFSGLSSTPNPSKTPIQFPPIEIHVDGINTKQYVKGLKGKPGTCRPADLTKYVNNLRRQFTVNVVYSDAMEPYILYMYIVHAQKPETLVDQIERNGLHIPVDATKKTIQRDYELNQDDDIVMDTSSISLRCPLTYARMKHPMKSTTCDHVQCFDGLSFLTMQERIPSWICPVCSAQMDQNSLAVLDYMNDILQKTSEEVDTVMLNTDGSWAIQTETEGNAKNESSPAPKSPSAAASVPPPEQSVEPANESIEVISLDSDSEDEAPPARPTTQNEPTPQQTPSQASPSTQHNTPLLTHAQVPAPNLPKPMNREHQTTSENVLQHNRATSSNSSATHSDVSGQPYRAPPASTNRNYSSNVPQAPWLNDGGRNSSTSSVSGMSGMSGLSGLSGISANSGMSGFSGASGASGASGNSGLSGASKLSSLSNMSARTGLSALNSMRGMEVDDSSSDNEPLARHEDVPLSHVSRRKAPTIPEELDLGTEARPSLPPVRTQQNLPSRDVQMSPPPVSNRSTLITSLQSPQLSHHGSPVLPAPSSSGQQSGTRLPSINSLTRQDPPPPPNDRFHVPWAKENPVQKSAVSEIGKANLFSPQPPVNQQNMLPIQPLAPKPVFGWNLNNGNKNRQEGEASKSVDETPQERNSTPSLHPQSRAPSASESARQTPSGNQTPQLSSETQPISAPEKPEPQPLQTHGRRESRLTSSPVIVASKSASAEEAPLRTGSLENRAQSTPSIPQRPSTSEVSDNLRPSLHQGPHSAGSLSSNSESVRQNAIAERYRQLILTSSSLINNYNRMALNPSSTPPNNSGIPVLPSLPQLSSPPLNPPSQPGTNGSQQKPEDRASKTPGNTPAASEASGSVAGANTAGASATGASAASGSTVSGTTAPANTTGNNDANKTSSETHPRVVNKQFKLNKDAQGEDQTVSVSPLTTSNKAAVDKDSEKLAEQAREKQPEVLEPPRALIQTKADSLPEKAAERTQNEPDRQSEPTKPTAPQPPARSENYLRSAFDVLTEEDALEKIRGVLGIEVTGNIWRSRSPFNRAPPQDGESERPTPPQATPEVDRVQEHSGESTSPIDSRIERMSIETPNGKKRSILNSSTERSWNKRLNRQGLKKFDPSEINSSQIIELDD